MNEKTRILEMLSNGKITVEEAEKLLSALDAPPPSEGVELKDKRGRKPKKLRVVVDGYHHGDNTKKAKVNLTIPLSLVRTFGPIIMKNLPNDAKEEMANSGVDFAAIINDIETFVAENSEEEIINIDTEGEDAAKVRIYLE
jgi:hypothetical protein